MYISESIFYFNSQNSFNEYVFLSLYSIISYYYSNFNSLLR